MSTITHQVYFRLKHAPGSAQERDFLDHSREVLAAIPGVTGFQVLRQISPAADYTFGFSMQFADQAAYDRYNVHPAHVDYVQSTWLAEVAEFQEIDTQVAPLGEGGPLSPSASDS